MAENEAQEPRVTMPKPIRTLAESKAATYAFYPSMDSNIKPNPLAVVTDILGDKEHREYSKVVKECRFFFRHDPLAATVITKMVDMAINEIVVNTDHVSRVSQFELETFNAVKKDIRDFLRKAAFEYLLTGLVVPEISLTRIRQRELRRKSISRLSSLLYPTELWVRDAETVEIKKPPVGNKESYFALLPEDVIWFIQNKGEYPDGTEDKELYKQIVELYPDFVQQILEGEPKVLLDNPLVVKHVTLADTPYPMPYLFPAIESLRHKRNLRRMDYSIASRVISAILHVKMGSDDFPLTKDQEDEMDRLEEKFKWRQNLSVDDIERVFALFTNHTIDISWVFPEINALLESSKYDSVNQDIMVALGFPRILITGETERSFASDPQIATISPLHTMENIRRALLPIVELIFSELVRVNKRITTIPKIKFKSLDLLSMGLFYEGIAKLYETGNLSREDYAEAYGFDLATQLKKRAKEDEMFKELDIEPFQPVPHSNEPGRPTGSSAPEEGPQNA